MPSGKEEDPAVARHEAVAAREASGTTRGRVRTGAGSGSSGARRCRAPCAGSRLTPTRAAQAGGGPVRRDDVPRRTSRSLPSASRSERAGDPAALTAGARPPRPLLEARAGLDRPLREQVVEVEPRHDEPEVGERSSFGHGRSIVNPLESRTCAGSRCGRSAGRWSRSPSRHIALTARGGQAVAADLVAGERGLVHHRDVDAVSGEVIRGRRAARPRADDEDIRFEGRGRVLSLLGPGRTL